MFILKLDSAQGCCNSEDGTENDVVNSKIEAATLYGIHGSNGNGDLEKTIAALHLTAPNVSS